MFAEFKADIKADRSLQIDMVLDKRVEKFIFKVGERLSVVEERTIAMSVQVRQVEKGPAALQDSMDKLLEKLSRLRLSRRPLGAGSSGDQSRATRAATCGTDASGCWLVGRLHHFCAGLVGRRALGQVGGFPQRCCRAAPGRRHGPSSGQRPRSTRCFLALRIRHLTFFGRFAPSPTVCASLRRRRRPITCLPHRRAEPMRYGLILSPVWEVLAPFARAAAQFKAVSQGTFMTDPRRGLMRIISARCGCCVR